MELYLDEVESALGTIALVAGQEALVALGFIDDREGMMTRLSARFGPVTLRAKADPHGYASRVRAYLDGDLHALEAVASAPGGTTFQRRVWSALGTIAPGSTTSYGALAAAIGRPRAARAVGMANARNPIGLVIPCHRVVGAGGQLTGYAAGLWRKRWLLEHEGVELRGERLTSRSLSPRLDPTPPGEG